MTDRDEALRLADALEYDKPTDPYFDGILGDEPPLSAKDPWNGDTACRCDCGAWMEVVRPGKSQCIYCDDDADKRARWQAAATIRALLDERPKVKPLRWEDYPADDGPVISKAVCLYGTYFIVDDTDDFTGFYLELVSHDDARWWQHVRSTCETIMENVHDEDLTVMKAAAQADYERRILSALDRSDALQEIADLGQEMEGE